MFVVLVTDFGSVTEVYGPFGTSAEACRWAETNLRDIYRVFEMRAPDEVPTVVTEEQRRG